MSGTQALNDARTAYAGLALVHERLDAAKEEERCFIAHELHASWGQMLTVVKLRFAASGPGIGIAGDK